MKKGVIDNINQRIVDYLIQMGLAFEEIEENMWIVHEELQGVDNLVITYEDPIVIIRVNLTAIPDKNKENFYEKLLRLNASSLIHGAYALEEDKVVIVDTLQAENLDLNELQASIESIIMAIGNDYKELTQF